MPKMFCCAFPSDSYPDDTGFSDVVRVRPSIESWRWLLVGVADLL
jgi:hypothetical protein